MSSLWPVAVVTLELLLKLALVVYILLRRPGRPTSTLAWIVVILAVPGLGIAGYLLVGEPRLSRRRVAQHASAVARLHHSPAFTPAQAAMRSTEIGHAFRPIATLAETVGNSGPVGGNSVQLIATTDLFVQTLVMDIDAATSHCHLLYYIFLEDASGVRVAEALIAAARRGVRCRLLVDAVGSRSFARSTLRRRLREAGVEVVEALRANPLRFILARLDLRNHRKITVIDGRIGYMGSQNVADAAFAIKPRYAPWVDATLRIEGPAARQLQMLFLEDWYLDTDAPLDDVLGMEPGGLPDGVAIQIMGTGPNTYNEALRQLIITALHTAREEVILTTPYFVPDEATAMAVGTAARRGVTTILILPARNDSPLVAAASRSHYAPLLQAGVRIFEFQKGLLHSKTMTIDRSLALVSSANLDRRSFELNFEVSAVVYDSDFASQLRFLQTSYLSDSRPVDLASWNHRRWTSRLWENAAGTLSPLL